MIAWHIGKQLTEHGAEQTGQGVDKASALADFHNAEPKRQHAGETEGYFEGGFGGVEGGIHNGGKHFQIAKAHELDGGDDKGYEEEGYPNIIQYHNIVCVYLLDGQK
ncbi:unknown [Prevotella sp. CAG:891]|nr:unknown [Prevotella sp. CAG:891]